MNKDILYKLAKGLGITIVVSSIVSISLGIFFSNYIAWFLLATLLQFLAFYIVGEVIKRNNSKKMAEYLLRQSEIQAQQSATVVCPCDKRINTTLPIKFNRDNTYECAGCKKDIVVNIELKTALITTPVSVNPIDTPLLEEHVKQLLAKNNVI